jgi:nucleotide-binding universal stress UspA family protein
MYQEILVPIDDGLDNNDCALEEAAELADETGGSIQLIYVWIDENEQQKQTPFDGDHPEPIEYGLEFLEDYDVDVDSTTTVGDPAEEICFYAAEHNADAIVMGTYSRTGLHRALLGSTTEEVVRKSSRPVVVVSKKSEEASTTDTDEDE